MRLRKVQLKNYRIHKDTTVEFHARTSLVCGLNESGKSTLVEAMHRALFLRAKGGTKTHKALQTDGASEKPEVRLWFEHDGQRYELYKRFAGTSGSTAQLRRNGSLLAEGEAAEEELGRITGADPGKGGKDLGERWSHLWVWQGDSGDDPLTFVGDTSDQLMQRLEEFGAGAVSMSALDTELARKFAARAEASYVKSGKKAKAGSALERTTTEQRHCEEYLAELTERVAKLETAARTHRREDENAVKLERAIAESAELLERKVAARDLASAARTKLEQLAAEVDRAAHRADALAEDLREVLAWNHRLEALATVTSAEASGAALEQAWREAREHHRGRERERHLAEDELQELNRRSVHANDEVRQFQLRAELERGATAVERLEEIEREGIQLKDQLARLPAHEPARIKLLNDLERKLEKLRDQLERNASGLTLQKATAPLSVDGREVAPGTRVTLRDGSVLRYGDTLSLTLQLPGAADAAAARRSLQTAEHDLRDALLATVIEGRAARSVEEALAAMDRRRLLGKDFAANQRRREEANPVALREAHRETVRKLTAIQAKYRGERVDDWNDADDEQRAQERAQRYARQFAEQTSVLGEIRLDVVRLNAQAEAKREAWEESRDKLRVRVQERGKTQALIDHTLRSHDNSLDRLRVRVEDAAKVAHELEARLDRERRACEQHDAAGLARTCERLRKGLAIDRQKLAAANERKNQAIGVVQASGTETDPFGEHRAAEEALAAAKSACEAATLEARADQLLARLFAEHADAANQRLTEPLAERISGYLKPLFGPDTRVTLSYDDGGFGHFHLERPGFATYPEPFAQLSGGAREQVAAAVRLATAGILAEDFDGCLPVVFDDAFTFTDHARVGGVLDMLSYAGEEGLQVIVSTCHEELYTGIGERQARLARGAGASQLV